MRSLAFFPYSNSAIRVESYLNIHELLSVYWDLVFFFRPWCRGIVIDGITPLTEYMIYVYLCIWIFVRLSVSVCLPILSLSLSSSFCLFIYLFLSVYLFNSSLSLSLSLTFLFYFPSVALSPSPSLPPAFSSVIPSAVSSSSPPLCLSLFCLTNYLYVCICYLPSPRHLHKKNRYGSTHFKNPLHSSPSVFKSNDLYYPTKQLFALYFHIDSR